MLPEKFLEDTGGIYVFLRESHRFILTNRRRSCKFVQIIFFVRKLKRWIEMTWHKTCTNRVINDTNRIFFPIGIVTLKIWIPRINMNEDDTIVKRNSFT
jgi:hypothetical protein